MTACVEDHLTRWQWAALVGRGPGGPGKGGAVAVEGCAGWRYVAEEIAAAGFEAHVAEPADTQAARGRKKHAKTDRSDAKLLRELLARRARAPAQSPRTG